MATGQGTATVNFGTMGGAGSNEASIAVTGQASILATSKAEAYVMADDTTTDHTAEDHRYFSADVGLTCGTPTAATGFTIYARCRQKLTGQYLIRWVWAD
jgi:hypothetical protein